MQTKLTPKPNKQLTTYLNNLYDLTDQFDDLTDKIKFAKNHELTQETITDLCEDIIDNGADREYLNNNQEVHKPRMCVYSM